MVQRKVPVKVNELRGILNGLFLLLAVCDVRELLGNVISQTSDNLTATERETSFTSTNVKLRLRLAQPSLGVAPPSVGVAQPSVGVAQPGVGLAQPIVGVAQPSVGVAQPGVGVAQPIVRVAQPSVGVAQPSVGVAPLIDPRSSSHTNL